MKGDQIDRPAGLLRGADNHAGLLLANTVFQLLQKNQFVLDVRELRRFRLDMQIDIPAGPEVIDAGSKEPDRAALPKMSFGTVANRGDFIMGQPYRASGALW